MEETITKGFNIPIEKLTQVNEVINAKIRESKQNVTFSDVMQEAIEDLIKKYGVDSNV